MTFADIIIGPLYFVIVFLLAKFFEKRLVKDDFERKYYYRALLFKLFGVTFFVLIYQFYYGGGDTVGFYAWSQKFLSYLVNDFSNALSYLFTNNAEPFFKFRYNYTPQHYGYLLKYGSRESSFIKISSIINLFSLNTFLSTSYVFAFISFLGNWLLYKVFIFYYPKIKLALTFAVLFIPSVAFWGTGVMKDTISFASLCLLVYTFHKAFILGEKRVRNIFILFIAAYFIMLLKAYILIAFLPAGILWFFNHKKANIRSKSLRMLLTPLFIGLIIGTLASLVFLIGDKAGRFSITNIEQTTKDFQNWHQVASEGGSGYVIHSTGTSFQSLVSAFPESVNVTYFRPYLWEARSIVVLMGALESTIVFLLFVFVFFIKGKIIYFFRAIFSKPIIQMCLIFALLFGFVVGFTSFNFGALARYKVPSMPFFIAFLVMVSHQIDVISNKLK